MNTQSNINDNINLFRYMDFYKFVSFLTEGLFIPRVDMFDDKWDGAIPFPKAEEVKVDLYGDKDNNLLNKFVEDGKPIISNELLIFHKLNREIESYLENKKFIKYNPFSIKELREFSNKIHNEVISKEFNEDNVKNIIREIYLTLFKAEQKATLVSCWYAH